MPIPSPVSSLRAARGTPMQAPGMGMPPSPYTSPNPGPAGGLAKPTPATGPAPTGYTSTGMPYNGVTPGDPTQVITPTGPAMRQVQPGGNITEWQMNQPTAPATRGLVGSVPLDPGGMSGGTPGAGAAPPAETTFGVNDLLKWMDQFKPTQLPREYGAPRENERAAESATFGRAADRIAQAGQGRLQSLKSYYANRGLSGSPVEAGGVATVKNKIGGEIGDTIREQAIQSNARDMAVNDRNLASQVSQRGQDLANSNWKPSVFSMLGGLIRQGLRP
jgi:hypothetical protein